MIKSPKYKVNHFLSNFSNNTKKLNNNTNNNENLYNMPNPEYKNSNYYELFKKEIIIIKLQIIQIIIL